MNKKKIDNKNEYLEEKASGKLILLGEHAVVYGYPCIAIAINRYLTAAVTFSETKKDIVITPEVPNQSFIKETIKFFRKRFGKKEPIFVKTKSEIGDYGFGSSAAVVVATMKALSRLFGIKIDNQALFDCCYQIVLNVQGNASGCDVAAAIYGSTLSSVPYHGYGVYFAQNGKIIESFDIFDLPLVVAYSGLKAETVNQINLVKEKMKSYKKGVIKIFENIAKLVDQAKIAISDKDWVRLGILMNYNQDYLESLGVSTEKLNSLILAARKAGALGAKLSGAGGGDCVIALVSKETENQVKEAIIRAGGQIIKI